MTGGHGLLDYNGLTQGDNLAWQQSVQDERNNLARKLADAITEAIRWRGQAELDAQLRMSVEAERNDLVRKLAYTASDAVWWRSQAEGNAKLRIAVEAERDDLARRLADAENEIARLNADFAALMKLAARPDPEPAPDDPIYRALRVNWRG